MEHIMTSQMLTELQQSSPFNCALPGTWKLAAGRAITLQPRGAGILRVAHGQLWATFDGPHGGPPNDLGDHFVGVGERLRLRAGQRLVVEARDAKAPTYFRWDPLPAGAQVPRLAPVVGPLADLRTALVMGAGAARRLVAGLAALAWDVTTRRGRENLPECQLSRCAMN
jgi:Protein of unknown function (DUF2917)